MTDKPKAGDLSRLREPALAAERQYVALAALARQPNTASVSLRALAGLADEEEGFAWLWALLMEGEQRWAQAVLPTPVAVPAALEEQVARFIEAASEQRTRLSDVRVSGAARLLTSLGQTPFGLRLAKATLLNAPIEATEIRQAALDLLASSSEPEARSLAMDCLARIFRDLGVTPGRDVVALAER